MKTLQRRLVRVAAAAVAVVGWGAVIVGPTGASAAIVTTPVGLSPGDQYRLGFVTIDTLDATSSDISVYNQFVQDAADAQPELLALGATWKAIVSVDLGLGARSNTGTSPFNPLSFPIYLLDGITKIADANTDLWDGTIDNPFNIFVDGSPFSIRSVWTGTAPNGFPTPGTGLGSTDPDAGVAGVTGSSWIRDINTVPPAARLPFYALSSPLTVAAVPLPGALILFGSGLACLAVLRRRNRSVRPA